MHPAQEQLYWHTLRELVAAGIEFCVIGTFALRQQFPALADWPVQDCDILLPNHLPMLNRLAAHLQAAGWEIHLWQEPVGLPLTAAQLAGKYYLRARQAGATLDCTYECEWLDWPTVATGCRGLRGVPLASPEHTLFLKSRRNSPADQHVIRLCQGEPGGAASGNNIDCAS